MKQIINMNEKSIDPCLTCTQKEDALNALAVRLEAQGFVNSQFSGDLIAREKEYPTGLMFPYINIALAHTSPADVNTSAIAVGKCFRPVTFFSMEDPEKAVDVEAVFVLALKNPDLHLDILSRISEMFIDENWCNRFKRTGNAEENCQLIKAYLFQN